MAFKLDNHSLLLLGGLAVVLVLVWLGGPNLSGYAPWLLALVCVGMHLFMGHGGHGAKSGGHSH